MKKILDEVCMVTFGSGIALAGASAIYIGASAVRKTPLTAAYAMGLGATFVHFGTQVAIGAVERMRGLQ